MLTFKKHSSILHKLILTSGVTLALISVALVIGTTFSTSRAAITDPVSLWSEEDVPATVNSGDPGSVELGVKFRSSYTGYIESISFYKGDQNTGQHVGNLWTLDGVNLASVQFETETASGWQKAYFDEPVAINANTTYVASYFAPSGNFSINNGQFASAGHTNGPLTALANGVEGANGVYAYNGSSTFPQNPSSSDNYWVDVGFTARAVSQPTSVHAVQQDDSAILNWQPSAINANALTSYEVLRDGSLIATLPADTLSYTDTSNLKVGESYTYSVRGVDIEDTRTPDAQAGTVNFIDAHRSVKALDSTATINDPEWFIQAKNEGFELYVMHSTAWGTCDAWYNTEVQLGMALDAGLKIAVYTRDPSCWEGGIEAVGPYRDQLQFFALDVESDPGTPVTRVMVDGIKAMGVRPVIYSGSGMWPDIQGSTADDFADVPLWDTNTSNFDYATWQPNYLAPNPIAYGGWNTADTMRIGTQQQFEYELNGVAVDLNSFDASFLTVGEETPEEPQTPETPGQPEAPETQPPTQTDNTPSSPAPSTSQPTQSNPSTDNPANGSSQIPDAIAQSDEPADTPGDSNTPRQEAIIEDEPRPRQESPRDEAVDYTPQILVFVLSGIGVLAASVTAAIVAAKRKK